MEGERRWYRLKWVDITRWANMFVLALLRIIRIWELKKISPDDPNSSIEKRLIFIELWIFITLLTNAVGKLSVAFCF